MERCLYLDAEGDGFARRDNVWTFTNVAFVILTLPLNFPGSMQPTFQQLRQSANWITEYDAYIYGTKKLNKHPKAITRDPKGNPMTLEFLSEKGKFFCISTGGGVVGNYVEKKNM